MATKRRFPKGSWGEILQMCQHHGREKVLRVLEAQHRVLENLEADYWAEPESHGRAARLRTVLIKQDETLIRLRNMTDADICKALEAGSCTTN